jgi:CubicO group peptidase (beta-lactamase class C family)
MERKPLPEQTNNDWQTTSLRNMGISEKKLAEAIERIHDGTYQNIHSILIVKEGKLVFEEYFGGYTWSYNSEQFRGVFVNFGIDTMHNLASVTKSITSVLIGIAIDRGFISGVAEKMMTFFPEYTKLNDQRKGRITLNHLLTMTSGLEWNEMELSYDDSRNDLIQLFNVSDPIEYILSKPVDNLPGAKWYYNSGGTNLLGEIIRKASGLRMDDFAKTYLFAPLGITNFEWDYLTVDTIFASGNLKLRSRDIAKIGLLFLRGGIWKGKRIVSEKWIEESTRGHILPSGADGYGYHWWLETFHVDSISVDSFYAAGWGGQRLIVFPSLGLGVAFTGGNFGEEKPVDEIIVRYILPAVYNLQDDSESKFESDSISR